MKDPKSIFGFLSFVQDRRASNLLSYPWWVEPASPISHQFIDDFFVWVPTEVPTPSVTAFISLVKPVRFVTAEAPALHTPFWF